MSNEITKFVYEFYNVFLKENSLFIYDDTIEYKGEEYSIYTFDFDKLVGVEYVYIEGDYNLYVLNNKKIYQTIKYIKIQLKDIDFSENEDYIPNLCLINLPNTLEYIEIDGNFKIRSFQAPSNLVCLKITNNIWYEEMIPIPEHLKILDVFGCNLSKIEQLPKSLIYFNCSCNKIKSISSFPSQLEEFHCENNDLSFLNLSSIRGLKVLNINFNNISQLEIPKTLTSLFCSQNSIRLSSIPRTLQVLECKGCNIHNLPPLPYGLKSLKCSNNILNDLPVLPDSILFLDVSDCNLISLPYTLPKNLEELNCSYNYLTYIPFLNDNLKILNCRNNLIKRLNYLPDSLKYLDARKNLLISHNNPKNIKTIKI